MHKAEIIKFRNVGSRDVYNPTAPFPIDGINYIAARVESRPIETDSKVIFFKKDDDYVWFPDDKLPTFDLQDPFVTRIGDEILFGGVVFPIKRYSRLTWRTDFYRGKSIPDLEKLAEGPVGMKDIRLIELPNKKIGVFTRPRGRIGGRGKIGYMTIDSLDSLRDTDLLSAELIKGQFSREKWGGVNAVYRLYGSQLGVLGHIAHFTEDEFGNHIKHYYSMAFRFDYETRDTTPIKILVKRSDFPKGESKRSPQLDDVVISGGLIFIDDRLAELYVGLSDSQVGRIVIKNPFSE